MKIRLEFQPQDLWVGLYWRRKVEDGRLHIWLCLVPCLPLHMIIGRDRRWLAGAPPARPPRHWVTAVGSHGIIRRRPIH